MLRLQLRLGEAGLLSKRSQCGGDRAHVREVVRLESYSGRDQWKRRAGGREVVLIICIRRFSSANNLIPSTRPAKN